MTSLRKHLDTPRKHAPIAPPLKENSKAQYPGFTNGHGVAITPLASRDNAPSAPQSKFLRFERDSTRADLRLFFFLDKGKNGIEASHLDLTLLTVKPQEVFSNGEMRTALLDYNGTAFLLKVRGAAITRPPYFDQLYGTTKFDFKLPEGQQGQNLLEFDRILTNKHRHINIMFPELHEDFEARTFTYGSQHHFMSVKVAPGRTSVWRTVDKTTTELDSVDAIRAGDDVDLLLSAVLWFKRGSDDLQARAGWSWKVEQVKILRKEGTNGVHGPLEQLAL